MAIDPMSLMALLQASQGGGQGPSLGVPLNPMPQPAPIPQSVVPMSQQVAGIQLPTTPQSSPMAAYNEAPTPGTQDKTQEAQNDNFFTALNKQMDAYNLGVQQQRPLQMLNVPQNVPMPKLEQQNLMQFLQLLSGGR